MSRKLKHLLVLALRRRGERQVSDEQILGDGEFKGAKIYGIPANPSPLTGRRRVGVKRTSEVHS
jgi:hypothetical protein